MSGGADSEVWDAYRQAPRTSCPSGGHPGRDDLAAVHAIDLEVAVQREDDAAWVQLGHANQAGIGEGDPAIARLQPAKAHDLHLQVEADLKQTGAHEREHDRRARMVVPEQETRLGEHRLASPQWGLDLGSSQRVPSRENGPGG